MAKKTKGKSQKGDTKQHMETVFGEATTNIDSLLKNSVALSYLPADVRRKIEDAVRKLPPAKQIKAMQVLQEDLSMQFQLAKKQKIAGANAWEGIKKVKKDMKKKVKKEHRKVEEKAAEDILKQSKNGR